MSSDVDANRIFILDSLAHGLALDVLAGGFSLDAVSFSLNISKLDLMSKLTPQAPLADLLLVPILKLEPLFNPTPIPAHVNNQIRQVPTPGDTPIAASINEPENDLYLEFLIMFWCFLAFVISAALMAMCTKMKIMLDGNVERLERRMETEKPKNDVERWCLRRKMARELDTKRKEFDAKKKELERVSMEVAKELERT